MAYPANTYQDIKEITGQYLLENIGEMAVTGMIRFHEKRHRWIVSVLCETPRGVLPAGRLELDDDLNIVYATPRADMTRAVEEQLRRLPYFVLAEEEELKNKGFEPITI
jgi:hypothetical protein